MVGRIGGYISRFIGLARRLGHYDQRRGSTLGTQSGNVARDAVEVPAHLGNQHDIGAAGDAGSDGDMARVAAHHLQHHDALMAGAGRLQSVERFGGDGDGGRVAHRTLGLAHVVVDGLGHADERHARRRQQAAQDVEAAVAADADQPVETKLLQALDHLAGPVLQAAVRHRVGERIAAIGAAEERAALARQ